MRESLINFNNLNTQNDAPSRNFSSTINTVGEVPLRYKGFGLYHTASQDDIKKEINRAIVKVVLNNNTYITQDEIKKYAEEGFLKSTPWVNLEYAKSIFNANYDKVFDKLHQDVEQGISKNKLTKIFNDNLVFNMFYSMYDHKRVFKDQFINVLIDKIYEKAGTQNKIYMNQALEEQVKKAIVRSVNEKFNGKSDIIDDTFYNVLNRGFKIMHNLNNYFIDLPPSYQNSITNSASASGIAR